MSDKRGLSKGEKYSLIIAIIGILAASLISVWSISKSNDIAAQSAELETVSLDFALGTNVLVKKGRVEIYYGVGFAPDSNSYAILPVKIYNSGKKTVEDVLVTYEFKKNTIGVLDSSFKVGYIETQPERGTSNALNSDVTFYRLPKFNPHGILPLMEFIKVSPLEIVEFNLDSMSDTTTHISLKVKNKHVVNLSIDANDFIGNSLTVVVDYEWHTSLPDIINSVVTSKQASENKDTVQMEFYVITPPIAKLLNGTSVFYSQDENIWYCELDENFRHVSVRNGATKGVKKYTLPLLKDVPIMKY